MEGPILPPRSLLWPALVARLDEVEVQEVKSMIGSEVIENNELVHGEIATLSIILKEAYTMNAAVREELRCTPAMGSPGREPSGSTSTQAPTRQAVEVLQQQILYFVDRIHAAGAGEPAVPPLQLGGALPSTPLIASTPREAAMYRFVSSRGSATRPSSASRPSRGSSAGGFSASRPSTAASCSTEGRSTATAPELLESLPGVLSLSSLDTVSSQLRGALEEEGEALEGDLHYCHICLKEAAEERMALDKALAARRGAAAAAAPAPSEGEPSVGDLRQYKARLQETWLGMEGPTAPMPQPKGRFASRLRGAVASDAQQAVPAEAPSQTLRRAGTAAGIMDDLEEMFG